MLILISLKYSKTMDANQITPEPGNQQNQPFKDNLSENQILPGNYQAEDAENRDENSQKEFPERTQQHDYNNPSANQNENDEEEVDEDELNTEGEAFGQDYEDNTNLPDEQPTDVSNLGLV